MSSLPPAMLNSSIVPMTRSKRGRIRCRCAVTRVGRDVARRAVAALRESPQHRPIVDVEHRAHVVRPRVIERAVADAVDVLGREVRAGDQQRAALRDVRLVDLRLADRHVGAVLAQEDQRERVLVLDAEHDRGREPRRIDADVADVAAFARDRLDEEAPHRVVADARDQAGAAGRAARSRTPCSPTSRRDTWRSSSRPRGARRSAARRNRRRSGRDRRCRADGLRRSALRFCIGVEYMQFPKQRPRVDLLPRRRASRAAGAKLTECAKYIWPARDLALILVVVALWGFSFVPIKWGLARCRRSRWRHCGSSSRRAARVLHAAAADPGEARHRVRSRDRRLPVRTAVPRHAARHAGRVCRRW